MMESENFIISVVIPVKNEEKTIETCIKSILKALKKIETWEIILVDSCSSDNTISIAFKYPIRIIQLKKNWFMSPAAGRYIGEKFSRGQYIFFIDADMKVNRKTFLKALDMLQNNETVAGVSGKITNIYSNMNIENEKLKNNDVERIVNFLGGPAIYKKRILEEIGNFNPFINGYEEKELGIRIHKKGYKQIIIGDVICEHYVKEKNITEIMEKASYFIGVGQFLRMHFSIFAIYEILKQYKILFLFLSTNSVFILILLFLILSKNWIVIFILLSIVITIFCLFLGKRKNLKKSCLSFCQLFLSSMYLFSGFMKHLKKADKYPLDPIILKK